MGDTVKAPPIQSDVTSSSDAALCAAAAETGASAVAASATSSSAIAAINQEGDEHLSAVREHLAEVVSSSLSTGLKSPPEATCVGVASAAAKNASEKQPDSCTSRKPSVPSSTQQSKKKASGTSFATSGRPAKKEKLEEYFLEIKWCKYDENAEYPNEYPEHSMFADEIPKRGGFTMSRAFLECEAGENHQHYFTMCLVDSKSEQRRVLVEIGIYYWTVPITLMHFNILSQDLANFCRELWVAAGRKEDQYCDMAIEFGDSKHSHVKISTLVGKATGIKGKKHVIYIDKAEMNEGASVENSLKLLRMVFSLFPAIVIAYEVDLKKLGICAGYANVGFEKIRNISCYVGPNKKFLKA